MLLVVDSSALVAIALLESEAIPFSELLHNAAKVYISAVTAVEANLVMLNKQGEIGSQQMSALIDILNIQVVAFDTEQSRIAIQAAHIYGKGLHPAKLNFGDCCSYALAKSLDLPLLFKGNDFSQTDLRAVV
jgi:ribonuclease VapC